MDLSSIESNFAREYLVTHCELQPHDDKSLTWYVTASALYSNYVNACYENNIAPLRFEQLWSVIRLTLPSVSATKLYGYGIYRGLRLFVRGMPDGLKFD